MRPIVLKAFSLVFTANIVVGMVNLLAAILFARLLGPDILGEYAGIAIGIELVFSVFNFGLNQSVLREPNDGNLYQAALAGVIIQVCAVTVACVLVATIWILVTHASTASLFLVGIPVLGARLLSVFTTLGYARTEAAMNYRPIVTAQVLSTVTGAFIGLYCASRGLGLSSLLLRDLVMAAVLMLGVHVAIGSLGEPRFELHHLRRLFDNSKTLWKLNILENLVLRVDQAIVGALLGRESLGVYFAVRGVFDGLLAFCTKPVQTVLYSWYCGDKSRERHISNLRKITILLACVTLMFGFFFPQFFSEKIILTIWGRHFIEGATLISGLVVYFFFAIWFENIKVFSMSFGLHRRAVFGRVLQLGFILTGGVALVATFGMQGVGPALSIGTVIASMTTCIYVLFVPKKSIEVR